MAGPHSSSVSSSHPKALIKNNKTPQIKKSHALFSITTNIITIPPSNLALILPPSPLLLIKRSQLTNNNNSSRPTAGAGAYYFAKKDINKDRAERAALELKKRKLNMMLEYGGSQALEDEAQARGLTGGSYTNNNNNNSNTNANSVSKSNPDLNTTAKGVKSGYRNSSAGGGNSNAGSDEGTVTRWPDVVNSPSLEARRGDPAPASQTQQAQQAQQQRSRYEATEPYRTRRGDRFS